VTTDTRPQPTVKQSIDTGLARLATSVLTWPIGLGVFAGRVSDATGLTKSVTGADPAPAPYDPAHPWVSSLKDPGNAFQALDEWTRFGTAEPNNLPQKLLEDAPSILSVPSLLGIGGGLASEAVVRGKEIRDALKDPATGASEGYLTAMGGGESQPLGPAVPQGPQTSTSASLSPNPQTPGVVAPQSPSPGSGSGVAPRPQAGTSTDAYKITLGTPYSSVPKPSGPYNITLGAPQPPTQQRTSFDPSTGYQITLNEPVSPDVAKTNEMVGRPSSEDDWWDKATLIVGGALLAVGLGTAGIKAARNMLGYTPKVGPGEVAGKVYPSTDRDIGHVSTEPNVGLAGAPGESIPTQVATTVYNNKAPMEAVTDLLPPGPARDKVKATIITSNNHAIDAMVGSFKKTGQFPGSTIKTPVAPEIVFQRVKALPPETQTAFSDVATLNSQINRSKSQGYKPWGVGSNQLTYQDMVDKRNGILNTHPEITQHIEDYHNLFPPALKYLEQDGVIDAAKRATLETANPTFSPIHRQFDTTWYDRLWGPPKGKSTDTSFLDLEKREDLTKEALNPGEIGNAIDLAEDYFHKLIAQTTVNRARVTFADSVQGLTRNGKPIVTYVTKAPTDPSTKAIRVFRNGHEEWMIPDTRGLYSAMQYRPRAGFTFMTVLNQLRAQLYTGNANPLAALKTATYDAVMAPSMIPSGTTISPLAQGVETGGQILKTLGVTKRDIAIPSGVARYDPTAPLLIPVWGTARGMWGKAAHSMHLSLDSALQNDGFLVRTLGAGNMDAGRQNVSSLSALMKDAFERSTVAVGEKYGALSSDRYAVMDDRGSASDMLSNVPGIKELKGVMAHVPGINMATGVLDSVRESTRLQFLSANIKRQLTVRNYTFQIGSRKFDRPVMAWEPTGDLTKTAAQTRRLMGDPAEVGGDMATPLGNAVQKGTAMTLYGNQSLQMTAQIMRMVKDHPLHFLSTQLALNTMGIGAWSWALSQPDVARQLDGMTPEQRSRVVPLAFNNKLYGFIGVPPEMRPFFGPALHGYLAATGHLTKGEFESPLAPGGTTYERTLQAATSKEGADLFTKALIHDYLPNFTDVAGVVASASGQRIEPNTLATIPAPKDELRDENDPDYKSSYRAIAENLLNNLGGQPIQAGLNALRETWAAHLHNSNVKDPAHLLDPVQVAADELVGPFREPKQAGPLNQLWGFGTDIKSGVSNLAYEKVWGKAIPKIKEIIAQGADQITAKGTRVLSGLNTPQGMIGLIPNQSGDPAAIKLYVAAKQLDAQLKPLRDQYHLANIQASNINGNPIYSDPKKRTVILNALNVRKRALNDEMLQAIRAAEHEAGVSFTQ
jgi:hypothetical protein